MSPAGRVNPFLLTIYIYINIIYNFIACNNFVYIADCVVADCVVADCVIADCIYC